MPAAYPEPTSQAVSAVMRGNRRSDTRPERLLRSALHARGFRFRTHLPIQVATIRVRPDIVFPRRRVAVFVDGCFWHGCPVHGTTPRANPAYWGPKLARNAERDRRDEAALQAAGWVVVRIWEHVPASEAADLVAAALRGDATR